jgi:hypothetical protein
MHAQRHERQERERARARARQLPPSPALSSPSHTCTDPPRARSHPVAVERERWEQRLRPRHALLVRAAHALGVLLGAALVVERVHKHTARAALARRRAKGAGQGEERARLAQGGGGGGAPRLGAADDRRARRVHLAREHRVCAQRGGAGRASRRRGDERGDAARDRLARGARLRLETDLHGGRAGTRGVPHAGKVSARARARTRATAPRRGSPPTPRHRPAMRGRGSAWLGWVTRERDGARAPPTPHPSSSP